MVKPRQKKEEEGGAGKRRGKGAKRGKGIAGAEVQTLRRFTTRLIQTGRLPLLKFVRWREYLVGGVVLKYITHIPKVLPPLGPA